MADESDVEKALANFIRAAISPNGQANPGANGVVTTTARGWPNSIELNNASNAGQVIVSVYPSPGVEKLTTRFSRQWQTLTPPTITLTAAVSGNSITFGGTISTPCTVMVVVNNQSYPYVVQATDTLATIASSSALLIPGATSSGPTITTAGGANLSCRVGGQGTIFRENRRQQKQFQVSCWCPTPALRDLTASIIDGAFAKITNLALEEGTGAPILYVKTYCDDGIQNANIYRRDLFYMVEYPTIETAQAWSVLAMPTSISPTYTPTTNVVF